MMNLIPFNSINTYNGNNPTLIATLLLDCESIQNLMFVYVSQLIDHSICPGSFLFLQSTHPSWLIYISSMVWTPLIKSNHILLQITTYTHFKLEIYLPYQRSITKYTRLLILFLTFKNLLHILNWLLIYLLVLILYFHSYY